MLSSLDIYLENTTSGHNKFYRMTRRSIGSRTWIATWGKIGQVSGNEKQYDMSVWGDMYRQKLKKGYKVMSTLRSITQGTTTPTSRSAPNPFIERARDLLDMIPFGLEDYENLKEIINDVDSGDGEFTAMDLKIMNNMYKMYKKYKITKDGK